MNTFIPHNPGYMDDLQSDMNSNNINFETTDDLLSIPFVYRFCASNFGPPNNMWKFSHYAIRDELLIAVYNDGYLWFVVGSIDDPSTVELPQWTGGKYCGKDDTGFIHEISGNDIRCIKSDWIHMKDDTVLRNVHITG